MSSAMSEIALDIHFAVASDVSGFFAREIICLSKFSWTLCDCLLSPRLVRSTPVGTPLPTLGLKAYLSLKAATGTPSMLASCRDCLYASIIVCAEGTRVSPISAKALAAFLASWSSPAKPESKSETSASNWFSPGFR